MEDGNPVRVERYIWIARGTNGVVIQNRYTAYLRIPPDVREVLRERYDLDLNKDAKRLVVETSLGEEKGENGDREMVIVHKIRKLPGAR